MYQKILVAIDDSSIAHKALCEAVKLAEKNNAQLLVLHVADESFIYHGGPGCDGVALVSLVQKQGKKILSNAKKVLAKHPQLQYETRLVELRTLKIRVAEIIIEQAIEWAADVLVLGTHGRRGVSRFFIGSVAENTIRLSSIPVLLVKEEG